jgi:outer membrane receptor protein involved in Fe transport
MKPCLFVACFLLIPALLIAQTFRGTILGSVTDPSGNVIAGATVKAHNTATGLERTVTTTADGSYTIPELPIGTYTVTINQSGFQTSVTDGVVVDVATERRVDIKLQVGQVSQIVEVSGEELPMVETTTNTLGGVLTAETVQNMPVNGRDYTKLIYLNPGVAGSPDQISDSPGSFGEFSMNGARGRSNNYLLDGTDMNDGYRNDPAINQAGVFGTPATILPIDAVAEVNVLSNFEPEYGRNAGAVINIVTKSGANSIHGTAAEYFRNDALDARNYFNISSQPKAKFHNNQFGASVGGPIIKNKTFFYVDYEGQQEPVGVVTISAVPTGNASDGSLAPSDSTNPVIQNLLMRHPWPAPNLVLGTPPVPGTLTCGAAPLNPCPTPGTASVISPSYNELTSMIVKIDQNFNANNILTGRYFFGDSVQSFPLALAAEGGQLPGFNTYTPTRVQLASISYVHTFSSSKINELRYGWNRFAEGFYPDDQGFHPSSIGMCAATSTLLCNGQPPYDSGLPTIIVSSPAYSVAQLGANSGDPRNRIDSNDQVLDNFSWKINKHDVKFGFDFHRTTVTQPQFDHNFRGRLSFDGTAGGANGNPLLDFLAGDIDSGFQYFGNTLRHTFEDSFGFYAQDNFRLTSRLNFNYGLRWDYFGVMGEKNNLLSNVTNFDLTGATFTLTQVGQPGLSRLYNSDKTNFAPRVSVAWDTTGKGRTVVRAGFGLFFDAFSQDMAMGHLPYSPYFDPGPAYNNIGPAPILSTGLAVSSISPGVPLYAPTTTCAFECDTFAFDPNIRTPYMENYNLNIQQQITNKTVIQIGYVGSQGHRLWRFFDLSQPSNATVTACDLGNPNNLPLLASCDGPPAIHDYSVPRNYIPNNPYGTTYLLQENSTGKSNYNALQTSFRVNNWHGITSIANFVWSRSMDNSSDGEDFEPNAAQPNDSNNPQLEYGPSNFDIRHRFSWNFAYEFPHRGGSWQRLKNGWGLNSVLSLQDGQPFQLNYNFESDFSGGGNGFDRPDVVGPIKYNPSNPFLFLDLSSFAIPCTLTSAALTAPTGTDADCVPGTRHYGNEGRDSLIAPSFKEWNFAIYKNTGLTEHINMQLRVDFFNLPNHPNFCNPFLPAYIADPGIAGFAVNSAGREVGAGPYPISATGDVGIGNPFLGGGGPRGIQLAAKFTF